MNKPQLVKWEHLPDLMESEGFYRISLRDIVSKYIGETEKNLDKLFDEAESMGAILLFDEAEDLFGKRSEVKDSHDRYFDLETEYVIARLMTSKVPVLVCLNSRCNVKKPKNQLKQVSEQRPTRRSSGTPQKRGAP